MKKYLIAGLSVLFVALTLVACGSEEPTPKPEPKPITVDVFSVKPEAVLQTDALMSPQLQGLNYEFIAYLSFKPTKEEQLGNVELEVSKVGGDEVAGSFFQICLEGDNGYCLTPPDNSFSTDLDITKVGEEKKFSLHYGLGAEKPTKASEAKLLVKVLRKGKLEKQFTIKMTHKP